MPPESRETDIIRVPTGIKGMDKMLCGGVPAGSAVLISGSPGTGKTILCVQIMMNACRSGQRCLYITLENGKESVIKQAKRFAWPINEYLDKGLLTIMSFDILRDRDIIGTIFKLISKNKISHVVIDSLTAMENSASFLFEAERFDVMVTQKKTRFVKHEEWLLRAAVHYFIQQLKSLPVTSFLVSEISDETKRYSSDSVSEFLADGLILLHYLSIGAEENRVIEVRKMRFTDHMKGSHNFLIEDKRGITVELDIGTKFS